jgi:hypothetical protein
MRCHLSRLRTLLGNANLQILLRFLCRPAELIPNAAAALNISTSTVALTVAAGLTSSLALIEADC